VNLGLYDFGDGGAVATRWQRRHAARKRQDQKKKHRLEAAANKKRELREQRADLKKRRAKWLAGWKRKAAAAKAAGLPKPSKMGIPWRLGLEQSQTIDMTGWVFGRLTVIRSAPISLTARTAQRCRCWVVKCSCGSPERTINGTYLRQGVKRCCGCTKRDRMAERRKLKPPPAPLSVKLLLEAQQQRTSGNRRVARLLELAAPPVRTAERRSARRKKRKARKVRA
jgi:hypothetical protein